MPKKYAFTTTVTLPNGKRKYIRGDTRKEVEQKKKELLKKIDASSFINSSMRVGDLAQLWYDANKKDQLHVRSLETIKGIFNRYILPSIGNIPVAEVRPINIQQMMANHSSYSKSTQRKILQYSKSMFLMAVENGLIPRNPVVSSIKAKGAATEEKVPLTHAQTDALLEAIKDTRAYPLVLLLLNSGIRIGEALGVRWSDIDFDSGILSVQRSIVYPESNKAGEINEDMKTSSARRNIPLPWNVVDELKRRMKNSNSIYVFSMQNGKFLSEASYRALWRLVTDREIDDSKDPSPLQVLDFHTHPHLLRHTCVTRWFESGLDIKEVQYLAGHADVEITLNVYTHYQEELRRNQTAEKIRSGCRSSAI